VEQNLEALFMKPIQVYVACLMNMVLSVPMNINTRNLKIGVKFKIRILFSPLYWNRYGLWFNKCLLTLQTEQIMSNEYRTFQQKFKNYSSQLNLFVYIHLFRLIALTPLEPSSSFTDALFCSHQTLVILFCLYHSLRALCIRCVTVATRLVPPMPSIVLYKAYCMPGSFYVAMDKPSRAFTLSQLHIWKCLF